MKVIIAAALCTAALVIGAPVATADSATFLSALEGERFYQTYGPTVLLNEGNKVCDAIERGRSEDAAGDMVEGDLHVSGFAAGEIVGAAVAGLGC